MNLFGLTIARTKALELREKAVISSLNLSQVSGSRGWWPLVIGDWTTGAWQRNDEINPVTVLRNPTLYACITLIAQDVAKLRKKLMELGRDGIWTETDSAAFSPFLRKPNHYQTHIEFFEWWIVSKLVHGNTYVLKVRDARGVVVAGYILDPCRVRPMVAPDGSVFYQLYEDALNQTESVAVPAREIIHDVCCPLFHPLCGVSPIYAAYLSALLGLTIRERASTFFSNGARPGGILTAPGNISQDTALRLKTYWDENFSGDNAGKIAVLGDGLKFDAMAVTADQSKLIEQLHATDEDICKVFHMPRWKVGVGPDPSYADVEGLNIVYYSDCLQSHIEKVELKLDEGLELSGFLRREGRTLGVEFERDDLTQMDTKSLIESEKNAEGIKTVNESRFRLSLPPVQGGNTVYRQQQDFSIEALDARDRANPAPSSTASSTSSTPTPDDAAAESKAAIAFGQDVTVLARRKALARVWPFGDANAA